MKNLISYEFNMDTGCVELQYADGSMIAIDCTAVEREVADNLHQRSALSAAERSYLAPTGRNTVTVAKP